MVRVLFRTLVAVVLGLAVALALVAAVEWFSSLVHPYPPDFDGDIPAHVRRYPNWVLAVAALLWAATGSAASWVASRVENRVAGGIVGVLLFGALIFNVTMLPYVMWFKVVMLAVFPVACVLGIRYGRPRRAMAR